MQNFWETKSLEQMSGDEWESLCDGCGLCCLVKIEDEESGEVFNTTVSCRLLDIENCRCNDYENRLAAAPMCTKLTLLNLLQMDWLPESCAYKCLAHDRSLPEWHYLVSGDRDAVHVAGISAKRFALSEEYIHPEQLSEFVVEFEK